MSALDGKQLVTDGKSIICALQRVAAEIGESRPEWVTTQLNMVLTSGLRVEVVTFSDSTPHGRMSHYAMSHLLENNKFKETTLRTMVGVVSGIVVSFSLRIKRADKGIMRER